MTVETLCKNAAEELSRAGCGDAEFDARCLTESVLDTDATGYFLRRTEEADSATAAKLSDLIRRRAEGEPLQYILGEWEFMGNRFKVGKGVLIPRPETELLVDFAESFLKGKCSPIVLDLCSGSGCIAVSVAKIFPDALVYAVEKSEKAFSYLKKNIELNSVKNVIAVLGDITDPECIKDVRADLILSNPPYIRRDDIPTLQKEVRREPAMALDGGTDGYDFYRALAEIWLPRLKENSAVSVECAEDQTEEIKKMFSLEGCDATVNKDLNGLPRTVTAYRR